MSLGLQSTRSPDTKDGRSYDLLSPSRLDLDHFYESRVTESWGSLPVCRPLDHTMFHALDEYVSQKLPTESIYDALLKGIHIEVHGIHPRHLPAVSSSLGIEDLRCVHGDSHPCKKVFNYIRPSFCRARRNGREVLIAAVVPGKDYVRHYAGLIRHFVFTHTFRAESHIDIFRYPDAERSIPAWSGLDHRFTPKGGTVVIGYVDEIARYLHELERCAPISRMENSSFGALHYELPDGRPLTLLGVKYSFWGSISASLCRAFCQLGTQEILYVGKLGALERASDVYTRIFCPSSFVVLDHKQIVESSFSISNGLLDVMPALDTRCHVSVPTVLEEDYVQRQTASTLGATSIDNEISQIAAFVRDHNAHSTSPVRFSALHFATDYVRSSSDRHVRCPLDLSNNRLRVAREKKDSMLRHMAQQHLFPYLGLRKSSRYESATSCPT